MRRIANIEINTEGDHAEMTFSVDASTECERVVIGTYVARALLDICSDIDPDMAALTAIKFVCVATKLPKSDERVLS